MERPAGIEPASSVWKTVALPLSYGSLFLIALSGCASNPPPVDNAYCVVYQRLPDPSDAVNMKKRENKVAVLTNEQSWIDFCGPEKSGLTGPR